MDRYRDPAAERAEAEAARAAESRLAIAMAYESPGRFVVTLAMQGFASLIPAWLALQQTARHTAAAPSVAFRGRGFSLP